MSAEPERDRRAFAPGVVQLEPDILALGVDILDELAQRLDLGVVPEPEVLRGGAPLRRDARALDEAQARAEGCNASDWCSWSQSMVCVSPRRRELTVNLVVWRNLPVMVGRLGDHR